MEAEGGLTGRGKKGEEGWGKGRKGVERERKGKGEGGRGKGEGGRRMPAVPSNPLACPCGTLMLKVRKA